MSQAIQFRDNAPLTFFKQKNYQWPVDNYVNIMEERMIARGSSALAANTLLSKYEDSVTIFEGEAAEEVIIRNGADAVRTMGRAPTIVNGLVTVQPGNIIFNNQQILSLAGEDIEVGGYGESNILNIAGYRVKFSDLKIALTEITTTTTSAVSNSTSVPVASRNGILDTASSVSGIGINPDVVDPTVASGAGSVSGAGTIVLSAAQTLESGITLTFTGAGQTATITGNIEIIEAGTADTNLRFDVEKLLSIT